MTFSVAVAGASGYAGGEILRLLAGHPELEVRCVTAHSNAGEEVTAVHPHLASYRGMRFEGTSAETLSGHDVVFLALPHGASGGIAAELSPRALVLDCGADHRLESADDWAAYYDGPWAGSWDYGMPELIVGGGLDGATHRQREALRRSRRIAVPGCNVTAVTFALAPLLAARLVTPESLTAVLAVGPSGAGKKASVSLLASELLGSANPYSPAGTHRHNPEMRQNLAKAAEEPVQLAFTPVLVPMSRGILATCSATLREGVAAGEVRAAVADAYASEPFLDVLPAATWPRTADVVGSNRVAIGVDVDERARRAVVITAIDNLGKGTAGAAVQSANIALGLDETLGLPLDGVAP